MIVLLLLKLEDGFLLESQFLLVLLLDVRLLVVRLVQLSLQMLILGLNLSYLQLKGLVLTHQAHVFALYQSNPQTLLRLPAILIVNLLITVLQFLVALALCLLPSIAQTCLLLVVILGYFRRRVLSTLGTHLLSENL